MARLPNFLVIIRSEKLSGKGQGRGAKKRTFRFGKKNVSFPKVETFRFADYTWEGLKGMLTKITPEGDVTAICAGTGIMPSLSFYYNRPQWKNDPMGEGPVLRALVEMIDAPAYTEIKAEQQYDKIK